MPAGSSMEPGLTRMQNTLLATGKKVSRNAVAVMIDHPVLTSFLVALGVRVVFAVSSSLLHEGVLIPDEGQYLTVAMTASEGRLTSEFWLGYGQSLFASTRTFMWPLTALFWVFGPFRIVGQILAAVFGAATAAASAGLAGRFLRRPFTLAAGLTVALFPSQILWSSVVLRESLIWAGLAAMALVVGYSQQSDSRSRIVLSAMLLGLLFVAMVWLRVQTAVLALWCICPALLLGGGRRAVRFLSAICLLVVVPWLVGLGPGAFGFADAAVNRLGISRSYMSLSADSSFVEAVPDSVLADSGVVEAVPDSVLADSGVVEAVPDSLLADSGVVEAVPDSLLACVDQLNRNRGGDSGTGNVRRFMIDRPSGEWVCISDTSGEILIVDNRLITSVKRVPGGLLDTLIRPLPWEASQNLGVLFAQLESILWVPMYALAIYGVWIHRKRYRLLAFPALLVLLIGLSGAVSHGNLGSAFRHRGQMLFALAVLAMGGVQAIVDARKGMRPVRGTGMRQVFSEVSPTLVAGNRRGFDGS